MFRHIENLKRLHRKFETRYGCHDQIVTQFAQEIENLERQQSRSQESDWPPGSAESPGLSIRRDPQRPASRSPLVSAA